MMLSKLPMMSGSVGEGENQQSNARVRVALTLKRYGVGGSLGGWPSDWLDERCFMRRVAYGAWWLWALCAALVLSLLCTQQSTRRPEEDRKLPGVPGSLDEVDEPCRATVRIVLCAVLCDAPSLLLVNQQ